MGTPPVLKNFIGGEWIAAGSAELCDVRNPATGDALARVPLSTAADVDAAVGAAARAFPGWRATPAVQRARFLFAFKALLDRNADELARTHGERQVAHRLQPAEHDRDVVERERRPFAEAHADTPGALPRFCHGSRSSRVPRIPCGRVIMSTMRSTE